MCPLPSPSIPPPTSTLPPQRITSAPMSLNAEIANSLTLSADSGRFWRSISYSNLSILKIFSSTLIFIIPYFFFSFFCLRRSYSSPRILFKINTIFFILFEVKSLVQPKTPLLLPFARLENKVESVNELSSCLRQVIERGITDPKHHVIVDRARLTLEKLEKEQPDVKKSPWIKFTRTLTSINTQHIFSCYNFSI